MSANPWLVPVSILVSVTTYVLLAVRFAFARGFAAGIKHADALHAEHLRVAHQEGRREMLQEVITDSQRLSLVPNPLRHRMH